jgi:redox-sensitive bicupin YhaK (pirin superfamily)
VPAGVEERAIYVAQGRVSIDGTAVEAGRTAVLAPEAAVELRAGAPARAMLLGGAPPDGGNRFIWWNFVSSRRERIEAARADWAARRMGRVPGETEFISLPS